MDFQEKIKLELNIPSENIIFQEPMKKHTSFKIGGPAECLIKIETKEQLQNSLKYVRENKIPVTILGNGSNVLVLDKGIKGIVLKIDIKGIEIQNEKENIYVTVNSGEKMAVLAHYLLKQEISGLENLSRNSRNHRWCN